MDNDRSERPGPTRGRINRRAYLLGAGAAVASFGALAVGGASATDEEYELVEVAANSTWNYWISDGETFENYLFDVSAPGAEIHITGYADDFVCRNIGIRGEIDSNRNPGLFRFQGNGLIENIYMGDGVPRDRFVDQGTIGVPASHSGHLTFRHIYMEGWDAEGLYAADPGGHSNHPGGRGTVTIEDSYFAEIGNATTGTGNHVRIASDGSVIKNSVIVNEETAHGRGLWTLYGDPSQRVEARNCQVYMPDQPALVSAHSAHHGGPAILEMHGGNLVGEIHGDYVEVADDVGSDPDLSVPDGVPTSAEEAASGGPVEDNPEDELPEEDEDTDVRELEVAGQFSYRIDVNGEIQPAEPHAQWLREGDSYGDDWAEWWLSGRDEAYTVWEFTGDLESLEIDEHDGEIDIRTLAVDGIELDHDEYLDPHVLEVAGQFAYRVEVDGEIWPTEPHAQWLSEGDAYGDDWAEWWLSGRDEAYTVWEFTGNLESLVIDDHDGDLEIRTLTVDGEELDHDEFR